MGGSSWADTEDENWKGDRTAPLGTAVLSKTFDILDEIAQHDGHITARELSSVTGVKRSTMYRILSALTARGIVRADPDTHGYHIGYRTLDIAQQVWSSSDISSVAAAELRRLRDVTGETSYLGVPEGDRMLCVGRFLSLHPIRSSAVLGSLKPLHCTAQGKALLAFFPEKRKLRMLACPLKPFTQRTITDPTLLDAELDRIRDRGFAVDDEEVAIDIRCVAAPILDANDLPIGSLSVAGPALRLGKDRLNVVADEVTDAARVVSAQLRPRALRQLRTSRYTVASRELVEDAFSPTPDPVTGSIHWMDRRAGRILTTDLKETVSRRWHGETAIGFAVTPHFGPFVTTGRSVWRVRDMEEFPLPAQATASAGIVGTSSILLALTDGQHGFLQRMQPDGRLAAAVRVSMPVASISVANDGTHAVLCVAGTNTLMSHHLASGKSKVIARIPSAAGIATATAFDRDGRVWVALRNGWSVARIDEAGDIVERLPLPVADPTGLCFGGSSGNDLFIISARPPEGANPLDGQLLRFT